MKIAVGVLSIVALVLGVSGLVHGHSYLTKSFDQLVDEAEQIFVGTIVDTRSFTAPSGEILTNVTFAPAQVLWGDVPAECYHDVPRRGG